MKKTTLLFALIISSIFYAQGTLHIFNYTNYNIDYTIWAQDENCYNSIEGYSSLHAGDAITYNNFIDVQPTNSPHVNHWTNSTPNTTQPQEIDFNAMPPFLFNLFTSSTQWKGIKFNTNTPYGGNSLGSSCGTPLIASVGGGNIPYNANWYYIGGEYYIIIQ